MDEKETKEVIDLAQYKKTKSTGVLREHPEFYEYELIPDYLNKFSGNQLEAIEIADCYASVLKNGDHYVLVSIVFEKDWTVPEIADWIKHYEVLLYDAEQSVINVHHSSEIIEAMKFYGQPLILSKRGTDSFTIQTKELFEMTEEYEKGQQLSCQDQAEQLDFLEELFDKDDMLDREYPGVSTGENPALNHLKENVYFSKSLRGLFFECQTCSLTSVVVHEREFEIDAPKCPHCGNDVDIDDGEWINGPF